VEFFAGSTISQMPVKPAGDTNASPSLKGHWESYRYRRPRWHL